MKYFKILNLVIAVLVSILVGLIILERAMTTYQEENIKHLLNIITIP